MTAPTLDSFFSAGGGKSISWKDKPIGTTVTGTVKTVHEPTQQTDYISKEPKFKKDGSPVMQVRIDLATNERDPQDPEDDGSRGLYSSGWLTGAIGDALRKAGVDGAPQVGGQLTVTLIERAPTDTPGLTFNKYAAVYVPPAAAATGQFFQQPAAVQPQAQPQYAPAPGGYAAPPPQYVQQPPVQQAPPQQTVTQPPAVYPPAATPPDQEPVRPPQIAEAAWAAMPLDVKKSVAATMSAMPGTVQSPGAPPF